MMTKQTGSALIVLLVGLLVSCAPSTIVEPLSNEIQLEPQKSCISIEEYINAVPTANLGAEAMRLKPRDVAVFQYNYNNEPPKSELQMSGIVFSKKSNAPRILVAIFIEKCLVDETPLMPQWIAKLMRPIETI
jgi:hypothetical protein